MARTQTETVTIRLTEAEKDEMAEKLLYSGVPSMRRFVVDMCTKGQIIVNTDLRELNAELRRQGNNLNQLTRLAHQGRINTVYLGELLDCYRRILQSIGGDASGDR